MNTIQIACQVKNINTDAPLPITISAMLLSLSEHINDPILRVFSRMTDSELRDPKQLVGLSLATGITFSEEGIFVAESRNVIERALNAGLKPFALISEKRWLEPHRDLFERIDALEQSGTALTGHASIPHGHTSISHCHASIPQFIGSHADIEQLTNFKRTVGPIAAFHRPALPSPESLLQHARRVAILEDITNFTNIGAIFRSAAALGIDAVLVTPGCHDPFYRRAARVSMGTVFQVPWTRIGTDHSWASEGITLLHEAGFQVAALALSDDSISLKDPRIAEAEKLALVLGTEGDGLATQTIIACDYTVRIPMAYEVDSLNVAAASAVAFWETCGQVL